MSTFNLQPLFSELFPDGSYVNSDLWYSYLMGYIRGACPLKKIDLG